MTKKFLILRAGSHVHLLTQFRAEGIPCVQRAVAHEPDALPPARLSRRSQVRPPETRPPPRRVPDDGDGRRLRRLAAPVAGVDRCGTAPSDGVRHGVRHGSRGCRPNKLLPPPPPRSDRSEPPPPASTTTAAADRPPLPTRRGGGPQLAGHGGRAVDVANREPHCPPPTRHAAHRPHNAIPRTGRHSRPRRTTPPSPKMSWPSAAWERRTGHCGRLPLAEPPLRPWRTRPPHATPAAEPTVCPPLHPTLARTPPHQAPHPTIPPPPSRRPPRPPSPRTPPRQPPHRRHVRHRALRTRAAPHPATRHLLQPLSARRRRHGASRHGLLTAGWPWRPPAAIEPTASASGRAGPVAMAVSAGPPNAATHPRTRRAPPRPATPTGAPADTRPLSPTVHLSRTHAPPTATPLRPEPESPAAPVDTVDARLCWKKKNPAQR